MCQQARICTLNLVQSTSTDPLAIIWWRKKPKLFTLYFILRLEPITIKLVSKPEDSSKPTNWVRFRSKCTAEKASSFTSPRGKHLELHWSMFTFNHHQHTIHFLRLQLDLFLPRINPVLVALKTFMKTNTLIMFYKQHCKKRLVSHFQNSIIVA